MKFLASRFRTCLRRLNIHENLLWRGWLLSRSDDVAESDDLDRVWRAECEEMDAILGRKDPGRFRK